MLKWTVSRGSTGPFNNSASTSLATIPAALLEESGRMLAAGEPPRQVFTVVYLELIS